MPPPRSCLLSAASALVAWVVPLAFAADASAQSGVRVYNEGVGQATQLRATSGELILRRRAAQYIGLLGAQPLHPDEPEGPRVTMQVRLRLETDLGLTEAIVNRTGNPDTFFVQDTLEVLAFEAQGLADGALDLGIGRLVHTGPTGFVHFDGAQLALQTPEGLRIGAFGGVVANAGLFRLNDGGLDTAAVERDNPAWDDLASVVGAELGLHTASVDLTFGAHTSTLLDDVGTPSLDPAVLYPATGAAPDLTREQKLGAALALRPLDALQIDASARYDAPLRTLDRVDLLVLLTPPGLESLRVGVGAERFVPTFHLDSIFNVFGALPTARTRVLAAWTHRAGWGELRVDAEGWRAAWTDDPDLTFPGLEGDDDSALGGHLGARWAMPGALRAWLPHLDLAAHLRAEGGYGGTLLSASLRARAEVLRDKAWGWAETRLVEVERPLQPLRSGPAWTQAAGTTLTTGDWGTLDAFAELTSDADFLYALSAFGRYRLDFDVLE